MKHQPYDYYISGNMVDQHILQISHVGSKKWQKIGYTRSLINYLFSRLAKLDVLMDE